MLNPMNQQDKKRINLLKTKLSGQMNNRIRLIDALSKRRDPLEEGRFEEDLEKCENVIMEFALQLTEMSVQHPDIDISQVLTADLLEVCKRNAWKVNEGDYLEIKNELVVVSKEILSDAVNHGKPSSDIETITSEISAKGTLELTIPIIPLLLNYKTELSLETKLNFKKMVLSLFRKIKGVLT